MLQADVVTARMGARCETLVDETVAHEQADTVRVRHFLEPFLALKPLISRKLHQYLLVDPLWTAS